LEWLSGGPARPAANHYQEFAACNLAEYYRGGDQQLARAYAEEALNLLQNAAEKDIDEPDYRRWTALAFQRIANAQEDDGNLTGAVASLAESIDVWRALYRELSNADRRDDLEKALTSALECTSDWKRPASDARQCWTKLLAELKPGGKKEPRSRASKAAKKSGK
jgi:hypothetical protein